MRLSSRQGATRFGGRHASVPIIELESATTGDEIDNFLKQKLIALVLHTLAIIRALGSLELVGSVKAVLVSIVFYNST